MVFTKTIKAVQEFINYESAGGIILFIAAVLAIVVANSPLNELYKLILSTPLSIELGHLAIAKPLLKWVNEGLMAIFFLLVGLEIKREIIEGELNSLSKLALPGIAAIGGMLVPALIYILFNMDNPSYLKGWAIPTATDIAFALGVLSLLGKRVPVSLKVFLTALAILDDLGAIVIIATYYTANLSILSLGLAAICLVSLFILNLSGIKNLAPYILIGIILWIFVLESGVHATLAGVVLAMAIPVKSKDGPVCSSLCRLERALHPWIAFAVLPIFAFFNAGISFRGISFDILTDSIPLGIALGLLIGKQLGIFGAVWLAVKSGLTKLPLGTDWRWIYGMSLVCGIGFTMSLFIGTLAFDEGNIHYAVVVRVGVLIGSILSGLIGFLVLYLASRKNHVAEEEVLE